MREQTPGSGQEAAPNVEQAPAQVGRRRLLQAAAIGVPVVLTLKSGSGWAASNCVPRTHVSIPGNVVDTNGKFLYRPAGFSNSDWNVVGNSANYSGKTLAELQTGPAGGPYWDVLKANNLYGSCFASVNFTPGHI